MLSDKKYMELALKLAEKGSGNTSPNPMVGCVIVKNSSIAGQGYHKKYGQDHAEIIALRQAGRKARGATMYVNLEPCSHWGKTPPCTESIIESGIREVVIAMKDPNKLVKGCEELVANGIRVKTGILVREAEKLNEPYIKYIRTKRPFVILKSASSIDGRTATLTGDSKYITGIEARKYAHKVRTEVDAVMVGVNTIIKDDSMLTPRLYTGKDPLKIIVDSSLKIPLKAKVLKYPAKVIIATTGRASKEKINAIHRLGASVIVLPSSNSKVDLKALMKELGKKGISSVMIEGGAELNTSAINEKIADKAMFFINPSIVGSGLSALGDLGIRAINKRINLKNISYKLLGNDILVEGYL